MKKFVYCGNCNALVTEDTICKCKPMVEEIKSIIPCPCCGGWGKHIGWVGKPVCKMCGGKRMVIEQKIYTKVDSEK